MKQSRNLGKMLLLSTITNTQNLNEKLLVPPEIEREEGDLKTIFSSISNTQLYSRLLGDIDFSKLSVEEQTKFLFLKPELVDSVDMQNLYANEMRQLVQEAHNRTCASLGVKPTNVVVCNFGENPLLDPWDYSAYDVTNGNIYINSEMDYSSVRSSFLLENINARTFQHSISQKTLTALTSPESLSDIDYYLAVANAVKEYVYETYDEPDDEGHYLEDEESYTPGAVTAQIYAYEKTRQDLQSAGIYGGKIRQELRESEEDFHKDLQETIGNESLINTEDIFAFFKGSPLNASSNGLLGRILDTIDVGYTSVFYNALGANMQPNTSVKGHLDTLENKMFEDYGLTPPTDEELQELIEIENQLRSQAEELGEDYEEDGSEELTEEDEQGDEESSSEDKVITYRPFESILGAEGVINNFKVLPFHVSEIQDVEQ